MRRRRSCSQKSAQRGGMTTCLGRVVVALALIELLIDVSGRGCEAAASSTLSLSSYRSISTNGLAFLRYQRHSLPLEYQQQALQLLTLRGGASTAASVQGDGESDAEEEDVSDSAEEEVDASLTVSAVKAAIKNKSKQEASKKEASKKAVNAKLQQQETKQVSKKSSKAASFFRVPYIIRALLNPFTVYKMTVAYWASLFNLDYLKKDPALELRSALEEKAKTSGAASGGGSASGGGRGKRKMKRGQAKTLNDLPQLSS